MDKGCWNCWHCGWTGGLGQPKIYPIQKNYRRPEKQAGTPSEGAIAWLVKRGIGMEVIDKYKIATGRVYMPQVEEEVNAIQFPYYRDEALINIKHRDKNKNFRMEQGAERILYGYDDIASITIFVEGEIDKLSIAQAGMFNCVSVPDGAPAENTRDYSTKFEFLDSAYDKLDKVETFILAVDNDAPGKRLEDELARRLGRDRCLRVIWPEGCKDANDVLVRYGAERLKSSICNASHFPIAGVQGLRDIEDDIDTLFVEGYPKGENTGWPTLDKHYTVHAGQWTLITGIPSHGKSEWLDALTFNIAENSGWSFGIFSAENQPIAFHAMKLIEKYCHKRNGNIDPVSVEYSNAKKFVSDHYHFIQQAGDVTLDGILDKARQLILRYGIRGLVIDPYNEIDHNLEHGQSETLYISELLTKIRKFTRQYQIHIWLVAHPQKLQKDKENGKYPVPHPYDVSGSAHWANKADNCIAVHRNPTDNNIPTSIYIQKVRFRWVGRVGEVHLWYVNNSGRFTETQYSSLEEAAHGQP